MIIERNNLKTIRTQAQDATIALRLGTYDVLHTGHQAGINFAAAKADMLVVGVMPDEYVTKEKGLERPIFRQEQRVTTIDQAEGVDYSFIAATSAFAMTSIFWHLRPDIYVEEDQHSLKQLKGMFLHLMGIELVVDSVSRIGSSSEIIARVGLAKAAIYSSLALSSSDVSTDS